MTNQSVSVTPQGEALHCRMYTRSDREKSYYSEKIIILRK